MSIDPVRHTQNCSRPDNYRTLGRRGDNLLRCRTCGRFQVLDANGEPSTAPRPAVIFEPVEIPREARLEASRRLGIGIWAWSPEAGDLVRIA